MLATTEEVLSALRSATGGSLSASFRGFYDSKLNAVITAAEMMRVPIDDHMVHRSHCLSDSLIVYQGRTYLLQSHLQRLLKLAQVAKIELPMPLESIGNTLKSLAATTGLQTGKVRYWLSAGPGNMAIWPESGQSCLYALAVDDCDVVKSLQTATGVSEVTVEVPMKSHEIAEIRKTNPLMDAMTALKAKEAGGFHGIMVDSEGFIAGSTGGNVCFLLPDGHFVTSPFDPQTEKSLITRIYDFAVAFRSSGGLQSVSQRKTTLMEAKSALEIIECTGDSLSPITSLDGNAVGNGSIGRLFRHFQSSLQEEITKSDSAYSECLSLS